MSSQYASLSMKQNLQTINACVQFQLHPRSVAGLKGSKSFRAQDFRYDDVDGEQTYISSSTLVSG